MNNNATTPFIPDFILELFQNEIKKINLMFLKSICKHYNIDFKEAKNKIEKEFNILFEISNNETINIVKKQKLLEPNERCIARIFKKQDVNVYQCTRRKGNNCDLCKKHKNMIDKNKLKYGTINDILPEKLTEKELKKIKKYTLY